MKNTAKKLRIESWGTLKFLVLALTCIILTWGTSLKAQNITAGEYFFDTDPGFGNGVAVSITPAPVIDNLNVNIDISGLSPGFHHVYFRFKDENGSWSHTHNQYFYKIQTTLPQIPNLVAVEYFFNNDPGFGNGMAVAITPTQDLDNLSFSADITSLSYGFHYLRVRVKDENGNWSLVHNTAFFKSTVPAVLQDIVKVEYFIDTDPGFGSGMDVPIAPVANITGLDFAIDVTNIQPGFHTLYTRVKDAEGKWSLTNSLAFYKESIALQLPDITKVEYFLDTDPGVGNGTDVPVTPATHITNLDYLVDITNLSSGFHTLYTRVKDAFGKWSLTKSYAFYKENMVLGLPDITKVEYFLDNDPGFGQGTNVPITPGLNKTVNWVVNIASVTPGFHTLYTRVQDSLGRWSLTNARPFYKDFIPPQLPKIKKAEYFVDTDPGFGQATEITFSQDTSNIELAFEIDITSLSLGFHQLYIRTKDDRGKWSLTLVRPFYKQIYYDTLPNLVQIEYFYDNDPGFGNGIPVAFNPAQQVPFLAWSLDLTNVEFGQHQLYIRTRDAAGKWSLAARDTIFYYLDSLPTASLNGPQSFCINGSGEFEVTLTGTPPWTLIYNTGEVIDTAYNIMVNPYVFTVEPTFSGTHTAQVLEVQDVYYTGLYTGIPIEYEVHPLPSAAGTIYGPDNICSGTGAVWYWIYGVANATAYNWTVPQGAAIVSNYNSNSILVDFTNVTGSGTVTVTPVNYCGQGTPSSVYVNIRPNPVVNAGPDLFIPYAGSDTLSATVTGGTGPYSYYWSPWYYLNNSYLENPVAYPSVTTTFSVQVTDSYGCSGSDQMVIYVGIPEGTIMTGNFSYDNDLNTPMNNSTVMVKQGNTIIASDTTDDAGAFWIPGIPAGYYYMTGTTDKAWGGVNATDALLVLQHYVEYITLTGLRFNAADVTAGYGINASDAFLIAKRYTGLTSTFPSGDWISETKYFTAAPVGTLSENLNALAFGDVDGSYIPGAKTANGIEIINDGILTTANTNIVDIPLLSTGELEAGAISLTLNIPDNASVVGMRTGKGTETGNFVWNVVGNQLKVAWYSLNPLKVNEGEALLWITVKIADNRELNWASADGSAVANGMGQTLNSVSFRIPKVSLEHSGFDLGENYPNPFSNYTTITFNLPEEGSASLRIYNAVGQEVSVLLNNEPIENGRHSILFESQDHPSGVYHYTLEFKGKTGSMQQTRKMVIAR